MGCGITIVDCGFGWAMKNRMQNGYWGLMIGDWMGIRFGDQN